MRSVRQLLVLCALATMSLALPADATTSVPNWMGAQRAALPAGGTQLSQGFLPGLSCPGVGNCVAIGAYLDVQGNTQGLLLNEVNGAWKHPMNIAAPANSASSPALTPYAVSCGSPGNCDAVGTYQDQTVSLQSFTIGERNNAWQGARPVTLPPNALSTGENAQLRAIACSANQSCSAVGTYLDNAVPAPRTQGLIVNEVHGVWSAGQEVQLPVDASVNPLVSLGQVACSSAGNCSAIGSYVDTNNVTRGLIVSEINGTWAPAIAMTIPANASSYALAQLSSLTCARTGGCVAIGTYETAQGFAEGFLVEGSGLHWKAPSEIAMPVSPATNPHVFLYGFNDVSCSSPGNCSAGGQYRDDAGRYEGFFDNQVNGIWQRASEMKLPRGAQMGGQNGGVVSISCTTNGSCSAGAAFIDDVGHYQALIVEEVHGVWLTGTKVVLPKGGGQVGVDGGVYNVVCHTPTLCEASGSYLTSPSTYEAFTLSTR